MRILNHDAVLVCDHELGLVGVTPRQAWVTISSRPVLVRPDPEGRPIASCPHVGPVIKPCGTTLAVREGYSALVRIDGDPVCLDTVTGLTDGTPPGTVYYSVKFPGQDFVSEAP